MSISTAVITKTETPPVPLSVTEESRWYAIQTRYNWERKVSDQLKQKDVENFLPVYKVIRRWSDRRKTMEIPAFPGYVFVRIAQQERLHVLQTAGVMSFVCFHGYAPPIPAKQIKDLQRLADNGLLCSASSALTVGQRVRIRGGCLDGIECVLVSRRGEKSLDLVIEPIQRSIRILISNYEMEAI